MVRNARADRPAHAAQAEEVAVPPPPTRAGVGAALRETFAVTPLPEEFRRLLRRLP